MNRSCGTSLRMCGWFICLAGCANFPLRPPALEDESLAPAVAASGGTKNAGATPEQSEAAGAGTAVAGAPAATAPGGRLPLTTVDLQDIPSVLAELEALGAIDLPTRDRLVADLKKTDPALWPQLLSYFKASLAYRQKYVDGDSIAQDSEPPATRAAAPVAGPNAVVRATDEPELLPKDLKAKRSLAKSRETAAALAAADVSTAAPRDMPIHDQAVQPAGYQAAAPTVEETAPATAEQNSPTAATANEASANPPTIVGNSTPATAATSVAQLPATAQVAAAGGAASAAAGSTPPSPSAAMVATGSTKPGSPAPAAEIDPLDWHAHLKAAIRGMERDTADPPATTSVIGRHAGLRLLYLVDGDRDGALRPLSGVSATQQDFWSQQLFGLATYLDAERTPDDGRRAAAAAVHLRDANLKLGDIATLSVRNLAFATEVHSYGAYKKFEHYEFHPGQEVLLYAEVENFKSAATDQGFHTALRSSYQILDNRGARVDQKEFEVTEEHCQNPRRDYFIRYFVWMPKRIYGGTYTLQLTIEDTLSQKIGQALIEFTVADKE